MDCVIACPAFCSEDKPHYTHKDPMKIRVVFTVLAAAVAFVCQATAADMPKAPVDSTNKPASVATPAPATDEVVARVNGAEIKRKELNGAVQAFAVQMARQGHPALPGQ